MRSHDAVPVECHLLMAKSRLAPIKPQTIPRLELLAATLAVKVSGIIQQELDIPVESVTFWTDSMIVLQYIHSENRRYHTFVANRIGMIRSSSSPNQWRHVTSRENVADDVSRGITSDEFTSNRRWWSGPEFLWHPDKNWPDQERLADVADDDPELKRSNLMTESYMIQEHDRSEDIIDKLFIRRSGWMELKRDVAWILRFISYLASKCRSDRQINYSRILTVVELEAAEQVIIRHIQRAHFWQDMKLNRANTLAKLDPFVNSNDILCVGGRLREAPGMSLQARHPMILPKSHHVVDLIIRHTHEKNGHVGREHVLSLLREKYWIVRGRVAVRRVLGRCIICKQLNARCGQQKMADLPSDRVTADKPPFTYVGIDLFGPFLVKRGRSVQKRYGCVFTCLAIRAVHIEIVHSLDTDSFLNALHRFVSRRGRPTEVRTDNGTNFKSGERELRKAIQDWNCKRIIEYFQQQEIVWKFNPPAASHWGGVWERQIRSVRKVLGSLLKEQNLDDEGLYTIMCQAESIVNSRPLTAISDDPNDFTALTPNQLLTLRSEPLMPFGVFAKEDNYCRKRWRQVQYIADQFWKRWSREYLPLLHQRTKWLRAMRDFKPGDIVLMIEDTPRGCWPLARITAVHRGTDGHVRSVTLKTRTSSTVRPISKICLLETVDSSVDSHSASDTD